MGGPRLRSDPILTRPMLEIIVVDVGGCPMGLCVRDVDEVHAAVAVHPVPGAPTVFEGLLDLRGELLPVLDGRRRLGMASRSMRLSDRFVVLRTRDRRVALRVDAVRGLEEVEMVDLDSATAVAPDPLRVIGTARLDEGLVVVYDADRFLRPDEAAQFESALAELERSTTP